MCVTESSCSLFHGQTHQFSRVGAAPDAKNVQQGTVMCRIPSHEPCAHACSSLLTPGGHEHAEAAVAVSLQQNQNVIGMQHIHSHAPHAKAPTRKESPTAGMSMHIWSQLASKLAHATACTLQRAQAKILATRSCGSRTQKCPLRTRHFSNFLRHPTRKLGMSSS